MGKAKYLLKRIRSMSFANMFNTIDLVHDKTNKNKVFIFFDIISCGIKYQAGYVDYNLYEMYKMNKKERKTVITRGINNDIIKKYNDMSYAYKFEDKALFNKLFDKYMNREWIYLKEASIDDFKNYLKGKKEIIIKPLSLSCGKGVEKLTVKDYKPEELYNHLLETDQTLVEDVAIQNKVLSNIYPYSVNTLRIVTLNKVVVAALLRIGNDNNVVDNFNHGGMVTTIDIETGEILFPAIDKVGNVYEKHPQTNESIVGVKIPMWEDVKNLCIEACDIVPELGYVGWDVCLGEEKPFLIEGNDFPGHDLYQLPVHRSDNYGLLPVFEKAMKEGK
ncbi:MAG: hypothetical protein J1F35_02980 [Erysipelotrichales bacterium]|nr:hypothetical protein [Erysipelotrichales bacterium]